MSCGFTELQELLGDDCGVSTSGKNGICLLVQERPERSCKQTSWILATLPVKLGMGLFGGPKALPSAKKKKSL